MSRRHGGLLSRLAVIALALGCFGSLGSVAMAGFEKAPITVEKAGENYRAAARVRKQEIVLEKVYVKSKDRTLQTPKVLYVDVYGATVKGNKPVKEHITPK